MGCAVQAVRETAAERWGETEAGSYEPHGSHEPPSEADALDELGDEIARLAAHLHAGRSRYLELVAEFDRRKGWEGAGHRSCAHWLSYRTGYDLRTARSHMRVARKLEALPATREAMRRGSWPSGRWPRTESPAARSSRTGRECQLKRPAGSSMKRAGGWSGGGRTGPSSATRGAGCTWRREGPLRGFRPTRSGRSCAKTGFGAPPSPPAAAARSGPGAPARPSSSRRGS